MTDLMLKENDVWGVLMSTDAVGGLNCKLWIYQAYDAADLHSSSDRTFTLTQVPILGRPEPEGAFYRLDIYARIGLRGSNSITYAGATSEHISTSPWSSRQFVRHFGFRTEPTGNTFDVTTNYAMPTTDPSLYMFAIATYNSG